MNRYRTVILCVLACGLAAFAMDRSAHAQQNDAAPAVKPDTITTIAGGGPNEIPARNANTYLPFQVAIDKQGNYYYASANGSSRIFKISPGGIISVVAGNGIAGYGGDGGLAADAELNAPHGVAVDGANPANVYINDSNCLIRKVDQKTGIITTIAGIVKRPFVRTCQSSGDGGAAKDAGVMAGWTVAVNPRNNDVYFSEDGAFAGNNTGRVRKIAGGTAEGTITTVAGNDNQCQGTAPDGVDATASDAYFCHPQSVALDTTVSPPNIFIDSWGERTIREVIGATGKMYRVAGIPYSYGFVDNVVATSAVFQDPWQLVLQVSGGKTTITMPDYSNNRIRRFTLTYSGGLPAPGKVTTIFGTGSGGYCGDGGPAKDACLDPDGLALDSAGNWIVADSAANRIRKINGKTGIITSIEGWSPTPNSTELAYSDPAGIKNVPGTGVTLNLPTGAYIEPKSGNLLIAADQTEAVYLLDVANGLVSDFAGNGIESYAGDGRVSTSPKVEVNNPDGIVEDSKGNVFIAEANNHDVREVYASTGEITTVVGGSENHLNGPGSSGNGGPAKDAKIDNPHFLAIDADDNLYISEYLNCWIRKVDAKTQIVSTYAGTGGCGYNGSNRPATTAALFAPQGITLDGQGNLYIAEGDDVIRKVDPATGLISIVAGGVGSGYNGDGPALTRTLNSPQGVYADKNGNIFLADDNNNLLRWVDPGGQMAAFAGSPPGSKGGSYGFAGDGGPATGALLGYPRGITQDNAGNFYFTDRNNDRVRKVTAFAGYGRSAGSLDFNDEKVGTTSAAQSVTLSAIGPVTIGAIRVPAGFKAANHCTGMKLERGETCNIEISFAPTKPGSYAGALTIASNAFLKSQGNTVALTGAGTSLAQAATPVIKPGTGSYSATQTVTIKDSTPGAAIFYTTNGSAPSSSSTAYTGAITVSSSEIINAIAIASGYENSAIGSATIFIQ
ncbi:MAG: chitobiase/beta-hexosaminidase C-terminal domain-containing protein [Terracidiphilus sp.]